MELSPELHRAISKPRLSTYEAIVGNGNPDDALLLYRLNAELSGAFIFPIQSIEVALRNAIASELDAFFYATDWLINVVDPINPIVDQRNPKFWMPSQLQKIEEAKMRLRKLGQYPTQGGMIADLDFGFWTSFLDKNFYHRLWPYIEGAFPHRPAALKRGPILDRLNRLRLFRNRIAHHEIIVNHPDTPTVVHDHFIETLGWISGDKASWTKRNSRVDAVWQTILKEKRARGWPRP